MDFHSPLPLFAVRKTSPCPRVVVWCFAVQSQPFEEVPREHIVRVQKHGWTRKRSQGKICWVASPTSPVSEFVSRQITRFHGRVASNPSFRRVPSQPELNEITFIRRNDSIIRVFLVLFTPQLKQIVQPLVKAIGRDELSDVATFSSKKVSKTIHSFVQSSTREHFTVRNTDKMHTAWSAPTNIMTYPGYIIAQTPKKTNPQVLQVSIGGFKHFSSVTAIVM
jgi:hypothetical protein